jgi:hypothetical protein
MSEKIVTTTREGMARYLEVCGVAAEEWGWTPDGDFVPLAVDDRGDGRQVNVVYERFAEVRPDLQPGALAEAIVSHEVLLLHGSGTAEAFGEVPVNVAEAVNKALTARQHALAA